MEKPAVAAYWRKFFMDLLVGTFKSLFLFGSAGFALGMSAAVILNLAYVDPLDWSGWLSWLVVILAAIWLGALGTLHGLTSSIIFVVSKKLSEMVLGLHDLMDILVSEVMKNYSSFDKKIPKKELAAKFDNVGKKFLNDLKLKKGLLSFMSRIIFGVILKVLKFIFLDDVVEELNKKKADHLGKADIESAVRRVGVEFAASSIKDNLMILHFLNFILLLITFSVPFAIFWLT